MSNGFVRLTKSSGGGSLTLTTTGTSGAATLIGSTLNIPIYSGTNIYNSDGTLTAARTLTLSTFPLSIVGSTTSRFFANGNFGIGTTTDAGYKADINGTTRIQNVLTTVGTASSDTATIGSQLATTASGTNWSGTLINEGFNHTIGSVVPLTSTLNAVIGTVYYISYLLDIDPEIGTGTISSFTFGGQNIPIVYNTFTSSAVVATTTGAIIVTPSSDYNGFVQVSVYAVTASTASIIYKKSDGTTVNEFRANTSNTNVFFGNAAGSNNYQGGSNTFIGSLAGQYNVSGQSNTFLGYSAGIRNTSGSYNSFVGTNAGALNTFGYENTFLGYQSGYSNTSGYQNTSIGLQAGRATTTGNNNVNIGHQSGYSNVTGNSNTFIGNSAGYSNTASQNTFIGSNAGRNNVSGIQNTFVGHQSGFSNSGSSSNTFIGFHAGLSNTAAQNTFVGTESGYNNGSQVGNVHLGYRTGYAGAGQGYNTYIGFSVGAAQTTAYQNTVLGSQAALNITTTNNMVAIGYQAARFYGNLSTNNTIGGSSGVYIGGQVNVGSSNATNEIAIGQGVTGLGSSTTVLGNNSTIFTALRGSVVIGTTVNTTSAILEVESTTKGVLIPRMTTAQRNSISSPATSLQIYNTSEGYIEYYDAFWGWLPIALQNEWKRKFGSEYFNDFGVNNTFTGDGVFQTAVANGGATSINSGTLPTTNNFVGLQGLGTGVNTNGVSSIRTDANFGRFWTLSNRISLISRFWLRDLITATDRYNVIFGISAGTNSTLTVGCAFIYDEGGVGTGTTASPNFQIITAVGSVRTNFVTSVVVAVDTWYDFRIESNSTFTQVLYYINDNLVLTETTNVPTNSNQALPIISLTKTAGTNNRVMAIDYIGYKIKFNTER